MRKRFNKDYINYIMPYNLEVGIPESNALRANTLIEYNKVFKDSKVELVLYNNLNWYDTYSYTKYKFNTKARNYMNLGDTDLNIFRAMQHTECQRRVQQLIELCCEFITKDASVYPVTVNLQRVHPGNTQLQAHIMIKKPCKVIRIVKPKYTDDAIVLARMYSIDDVQKLYNKPLYAFCLGIEKPTGIQFLVKHGNFTEFDRNGNLSWRSNTDPWPFKMFLQELVRNTSNVNNAEIVKFNYNDEEYEVKIPADDRLQKEIFLETIKWGNKNIQF